VDYLTDAEIYVIGADGQTDQLITDPTDGLQKYAPSWSPNDKYIAYHAYPPNESPTIQSGLFAMRPDGSGRVVLRPDGFEPVWQPMP
jgi:Tol biopolymer transport system component